MLTKRQIADQRTMSALGRTSKAFYSIVMPRLYRRVAIEDMLMFEGDGEFPGATAAEPHGLIRLLDPHLTNAQRRKLMREGQYGDQTVCPACPSLSERALMQLSLASLCHRAIPAAHP